MAYAGKLSRIFRPIAGFIVLAAITIFGVTLMRAIAWSPEPQMQDTQSAESVLVAESTSTPMRLYIPRLSIDTKVQRVGVKPNGAMATPSNFTDVGWYKLGTVPGQLGSAVVAGHVDNGLALAGVFKRLDQLRIGDEISVEQKDGQRLQFVVDEIVLYDKDNAPLEKIFERNDAARLNLVSCDGDWIPKEKTYDRRLVVYTKLVAP